MRKIPYETIIEFISYYAIKEYDTRRDQSISERKK